METERTHLVTEPASTNVVLETAPHLRWGAIFGGAVAALGIGAMLYALGLALGVSVIDVDDPASLRPSGIFAGIWAVVVALVALFAGGFVAARGAGAVSRGLAGLHGLVMWGLTVVAGVWLLTAIASTLVSGATAMGAAAADVAAEAVGETGRAPELAEEAERRAEGVAQRAEQTLAGARAEAMEAASESGPAFWGLFGALFLGMISAIGGAVVGGSQRGRPRAKRVEVVEPEPPPVVRREAYP